jgi:hypothetical protein
MEIPISLASSGSYDDEMKREGPISRDSLPGLGRAPTQTQPTLEESPEDNNKRKVLPSLTVGHQFQTSCMFWVGFLERGSEVSTKELASVKQNEEVIIWTKVFYIRSLGVFSDFVGWEIKPRAYLDVESNDSIPCIQA